MSIASPLEPPPARPTSTALEDPRTRQLDPVLARLVMTGRISADAAVRATATALEQRQSLAAAVTGLGLITSQDWAEAVARHYDFEMAGPDDLPRELPLADQISPRFLRHAAVLPIRASEDTVWLAMADPANSYAIKAIGLATQRRDHRHDLALKGETHRLDRVAVARIGHRQPHRIVRGAHG